MKILLTSNKTYRDNIDGIYWYTYLPLVEMGHKVYFYDTVNPQEKNYSKVMDINNQMLLNIILSKKS